MKIKTLTTFVVGKGKAVPPGSTVEIEDGEAQSLIDRGLAVAVAEPEKKPPPVDPPIDPPIDPK